MRVETSERIDGDRIVASACADALRLALMPSSHIQPTAEPGLLRVRHVTYLGILLMALSNTRDAGALTDKLELQASWTRHVAVWGLAAGKHKVGMSHVDLTEHVKTLSADLGMDVPLKTIAHYLVPTADLSRLCLGIMQRNDDDNSGARQGIISSLVAGQLT